MKIDLNNINKEEFTVREFLIGGEKVFLINPDGFKPKWTQRNKYLRSSVWNEKGELISAGYPKFVNLGENPDNFPIPKSLDGCKIFEKLDGSLLICSKYKDREIIRTRGTINAETLENGHEICLFKAKYPLVWDNLSDNYSLLLEWTSPNQRIVLDYGPEPELTLIGKVYHEDYRLETQDNLNKLAKELKVRRPDYFNFDTLEELISAVENFKDKEGVCLYSNNDTEIHKIKANLYKKLHYFKSNCSLEAILDIYIELNRPDYQTFRKELEQKFDFECVTFAQGYISDVVDANKEVKKIVEGMTGFVEKLRGIPRKDVALKIQAAYGTTNRAGFCFQIFDKRPLDNKSILKLFWQILKN